MDLEQAQRDLNVKKLFTLSGKEKLIIAIVVVVFAFVLNGNLDTNLAAPYFNQRTDCAIFAMMGSTPGPCVATGPEIRSAN